MRITAYCPPNLLPTTGSFRHFSPCKLLYLHGRRPTSLILRATGADYKWECAFSRGKILTISSTRQEEQVSSLLHKHRLISDQIYEATLVAKQKQGLSDTASLKSLIQPSLIKRGLDLALVQRLNNILVARTENFEILPCEQAPEPQAALAFFERQYFESTIRRLAEHDAPEEISRELASLSMDSQVVFAQDVPPTASEGLTKFITSLARFLSSPKPIGDILRLPVLQGQSATPRAALVLLLDLQIISPVLSEKEKIQFQRIGELVQKSTALNAMTFFEILGVPADEGIPSIRRRYHELVKLYHPDWYTGKTFAPYKALIEDYFSRITQAYANLNGDEKLREYKLQLELKKSGKNVDEFVSNVLQAEKAYADGDRFMKLKKYKLAVARFQEASRLSPEEQDYMAAVLYAEFWAYKEENSQESRTVLGKLETIATKQADPSKIYLLIGRCHQSLGSLSFAKYFYQKALKANKQFGEAKEALEALEKEERKEKR